MNDQPIHEERRDTTPICWICGAPMEWTGDYRTIELDGGFAGIVEEPVYQCYNPECYDEDEEEWW